MNIIDFFSQNPLLSVILFPLVSGIIVLFFTKGKFIKEFLTFAVTVINLIMAIGLYNKDFFNSYYWAGEKFGFDLTLRIYHFSGFILVAAAGFAFLLALYSWSYMADKKYKNQYYSYLLITLGFVNGAVLSNNLFAMLFFWEGLAIVLFGMIIIGKENSFKTAVKALIIDCVAGLLLLLGIALIGYLSFNHTYEMNIIQMHKISIAGIGGIAFILVMAGAIAKAGSMPFHSWIPDAALDAPIPFMAYVPAALEKLLGIYFLARICLDIFKLEPNSWASTTLMVIGVITILLAVAMALIQKNYTRLLSYHAISQVGYMILGIGTCIPAGIIGGIFHMINHAMYKCGLFLTSGSVEKQTGTSDMNKLGGLAGKMPVTMICFLVTAASISGVPPFNGFFSKELVYDGAFERGWIYYAGALLGSVLTAASFLKLGHAAYFDPLQKQNKKVKEAPLGILLPMIILAFMCILFGVYNQLPIQNLIQPILGEKLLEGKNYWGWPHSLFFILMTLGALLVAVLNHWYGVKKGGSGLHASDHIRNFPVIKNIYDMAEKRFFDPYDIGMVIVGLFSKLTWLIDRFIDWIYDTAIVRFTQFFSMFVRKFQNGSYSAYILWILIGFIIIILFVI
jgi:NADH-quinone oxidoreductase subunit L